MGLYVELMCDEHKGWPETPAFAGKIDLRCHSDAGDNPQGPTVAAARAAGKAAGWIVRGNYIAAAPVARMILRHQGGRDAR